VGYSVTREITAAHSLCVQAIAFKRIAPGLVVKVLEARPPPAAKYGGERVTLLLWRG
jgi:hypothetical protein